jgi:OOP family OmpA-OmpF porin
MIRTITLFFSSLLLLFSCFETSAQVLQNMVKNPSFEQYRQVYPVDLGQIKRAAYWSSATKAGADYYHERAKGTNVAVPRSKMGRTKGKSGRAYAGIYAYTSRYSKQNYREYIQVKLKHPMAPGEKYCVKMQVYLAESSNRALSALGVSGSKFEVMKDHEHHIDDMPFVYALKDDKRPINEREWVEISATYKANGGENFLIIGNFEDNKKTKVTGAIEIDSFRNPHVDFAYYFIDNVCVTSYKSNFTCNCGQFDYNTTTRREKIVVDFKIRPKTYKIGEVDILERVKFEKNRTVFQDGAQEDLDQLAAVMKMNPTYVIEISGHTDDRGGSPRENQFLSKRRARVVKDYLVASGIEEERLEYRGYGQSRPIAHNNSPEGRAKNERIQIKLLKK